MNNKGIISTSLSLACHTILLIFALNMVLTPPPISEPPPLLIHVHLDSRPFSPSMGNNGAKVRERKLNMAPEMNMTKIHNQQQVPNYPHQALSMNAPTVYKKPVISNNKVVSVVKPNVPSSRAPTEHNMHKTLYSTKEIFKDMVVANRKFSSSSMVPVSDISNQIQQMQIKPTLESEMQNYQGETPYLPSDQNGSGTDIKSFLGYDLYTYEDPSDHVKYFKLSIRVEDMPGGLVPMPKEITFLVDASGSIGNPLLEQFKTGIGESLDELGVSDKFNVIVFNDIVHKMQEQPVDNNISNVKQANDFLSDFRSVADTDLYDTVLKSVTSPHTIKPAYILLLSDGQPTLGITDSLQLVNKIGQINKGQVPIFGLGAGAYYNEYLMNFLTFTNHGWANFAPMDVANKITAMYAQIKDPVLINLRYNAVGLDKNEIYPKELPDLFKGSEFVQYGSYTTEGDFLFQLRGDSQYDTKKYVIKDNLNNGHQGDRTIAQEWAMRKIFNLIGQLQYDQNNQTIIDEINQLAAKFELKIPQYTTKG